METVSITSNGTEEDAAGYGTDGISPRLALLTVSTSGSERTNAMRRTKTPYESVCDYIDVQCDRNRGNLEIGRSNQYLKWESMREEWRSFKSTQDELTEVKQLYSDVIRFIKATGQTREMSEWISKNAK